MSRNFLSTAARKKFPMLVLSRKKDEKVLLPNLNITIQVLEIKGKSVRIGISAPKEHRVLRGELVEQQGWFDLSPAVLAQN